MEGVPDGFFLQGPQKHRMVQKSLLERRELNNAAKQPTTQQQSWVSRTLDAAKLVALEEPKHTTSEQMRYDRPRWNGTLLPTKPRKPRNIRPLERAAKMCRECSLLAISGTEVTSCQHSPSVSLVGATTVDVSAPRSTQTTTHEGDVSPTESASNHRAHRGFTSMQDAPSDIFSSLENFDKNLVRLRLFNPDEGEEDNDDTASRGIQTPVTSISSQQAIGQQAATARGTGSYRTGAGVANRRRKPGEKRTKAGPQVSLVDEPSTTGGNDATPMLSLADRLAARSTPIHGILIGVQPWALPSHYDAARTAVTEYAGMDVGAFEDMLKHAVPHVELSRSLVQRIFERYDTTLNNATRRLTFFQFLVQHGQEALPDEVEKSLVFFFDCFAQYPSTYNPHDASQTRPAKTMPATYLTESALLDYRKHTVRGAAGPQWTALAHAFGQSETHAREFLKQYCKSPTQAEQQVPKPRTALETRIFGQLPPLPVAQLSIKQLRYLVYSSETLSRHFTGLWFARQTATTAMPNVGTAVSERSRRGSDQHQQQSSSALTAR